MRKFDLQGDNYVQNFMKYSAKNLKRNATHQYKEELNLDEYLHPAYEYLVKEQTNQNQQWDEITPASLDVNGLVNIKASPLQLESSNNELDLNSGSKEKHTDTDKTSLNIDLLEDTVISDMDGMIKNMLITSFSQCFNDSKRSNGIGRLLGFETRPRPNQHHKISPIKVYP